MQEEPTAACADAPSAREHSTPGVFFGGVGRPTELSKCIIDSLFRCCFRLPLLPP